MTLQLNFAIELKVSPIKPCRFSVFTKANLGENKNKQQTNKQLTNVSTNIKQLAVLPYISGLSERLSKIYNKHISLCSKPGYTVRHALVAPKDLVQMLDKCHCGVVYHVECTKCEVCYIRETGQTLKTIMAEHEKSARDKNYKSALSQHQLDTGHKMDFRAAFP